MPTRIILVLMFGVLVVPAFAQDATPLTTEDISSLRERAEQGDADAQIRLGLLYHNGAGVPEDYTEARRLAIHVRDGRKFDEIDVDDAFHRCDRCGKRIVRRLGKGGIKVWGKCYRYQ